jgi:hypothetical protein
VRFSLKPNSKTQQVKGLVFSPDRRVAVHDMALDTNTLTGPPDDRGRPQAWIMANTLYTLDNGQPYVLLRSDDLAPVALPGEQTATITIDQRRTAIERRRSEVLAGGELKNPLDRILSLQIMTQFMIFGVVAIIAVVVLFKYVQIPWFN